MRISSFIQVRYPNQSSHWWKGCTRNCAVLTTLRSFGRERCCESKPQEPALYILLTMKAFGNLNFGYFCKKQQRRPPYICIYGLRYFWFLFQIKFWHKLALLCWPCNYTQRLHRLHIEPCNFFLPCSYTISVLNTAMMTSYLLESATGWKRFIPTLTKDSYYSHIWNSVFF